MVIAVRLLDERKQARETGYTSVNLTGMPDKTYSRFYKMKLTEASRRCVNLYALIEKIKIQELHPKSIRQQPIISNGGSKQ